MNNFNYKVKNMNIRNVVLIAFILFGPVAVTAQQLLVHDMRLVGEWQIKGVSREIYHMQQGNLLQNNEITSMDAIGAINGMVFLNIVFTDHNCWIKRNNGRESWNYRQRDTGRLEMNFPSSVTADPLQDGPVLLVRYSFNNEGELSVGPLIAGYVDKVTGTPVKMKYICHYRRIR